jgi:hypothetical protein
MLNRKITAFFVRSKHNTNTLCGQNVKCLIVDWWYIKQQLGFGGVISEYKT